MHRRTGRGSVLAPVEFQGTADDARSLLTTISSTVVTVIALVLGLTVVALQLASTQFSPRLLRNFLRDRPTQVVLSVFLATFTYSTAGLYTVGVAAGVRTERYPRLAVTGAIVLLLASLAMVVYFARPPGVLHSDRHGHRPGPLGVLDLVRRLPGTQEEAPPGPPACAVPVPRSTPGTCRPRTWVRCCRWPHGIRCGSRCTTGSVSTWSPGPSSRRYSGSRRTTRHPMSRRSRPRQSVAKSAPHHRGESSDRAIGALTGASDRDGGRRWSGPACRPLA